MEKPTWDKAPEWAKFLAQDGNGNWYWYASQPTWNEKTTVYEASDGITEYAGTEPVRGVIEERP